MNGADVGRFKAEVFSAVARFGVMDGVGVDVYSNDRVIWIQLREIKGAPSSPESHVVDESVVGWHMRRRESHLLSLRLIHAKVVARVRVGIVAAMRKPVPREGLRL